MGQGTQRIDRPTIIGLALLLLPLTTMWHEIGGHVVACVVQGGHVATLGAFYVECNGLSRIPNVVVACAGVVMDALLSVIAFRLWRRARGDLARLVLWYIWVEKAFVAAGYLCFSGVSGAGDLGPGSDGGIGPLPMPLLWRGAELVIGVILYIFIVRGAIRALTAMLGDAAATKPARVAIAHLYYVTLGVVAVLIGLLNPVGLAITIMSAAASSFGGNAGYISIGYAVPSGDMLRPFMIDRHWLLIAAGALVSIVFALVLGPSVRF